MTALGDLLELLYTARDRFTTVQATVRVWRHLPREAMAMERWKARHPPGSVSMLAAGGRGPRQGSTPETEERWTRLWLRKPSSLRVEEEIPDHEGTRLRIVTEGRTLAYTPVPGGEARLHEGVVSGFPALPLEAHAGLTLPLFDPVPLIPALAMELVGAVPYAGRDAIRVSGHVRDALEGGHTLLPWWRESDRIELLVDRETGVLLRAEAFLNGEPFAVVEMQEVVFGASLPDDLFTFMLPPNVRVRADPPPNRRHWRHGRPWWRRLLLHIATGHPQ